MGGLWGTFGNQAFRQRHQLGAAPVHLPDEAAIVKFADNDATRGAAQRFHPIARLQLGGFAQTLDDFHHRLPGKDPGDVMGDCRHDFTAAGCGQVGEKRRDNLTAYIGEGVAVEEKEGGAAVALPQEFYSFGEGEDSLLFFRPVSCARFLSLSIKAVLRASSCARSFIVADDRLPTPVFDKSGSGL